MRNTKTGAAVGSRHVPQRTCVSCRRIRDKRELVRLVRTPGGIEVDATGRKVGRGAYLCATSECWESGLKGNRLEHALRSSLTPDNRARLMDWAKDLPQGDD